MPKIIFTIDDGDHPLHNKAKFLRHIDTLRVMGKLEGEARTGVGHWVDEHGVSWLEPCYCLDIADYLQHVLPHGWVNQQKCVVAVGTIDAAVMSPDLVLTHRQLGALNCVGPKMPAGCWTKFDGCPDYWAA